MQESPPLFLTLRFSLSTLNFDFGPDFYYISSDLFQLGPPILIDRMRQFHFGPPTFNFQLGCKISINSVHKFQFFSTLSFNFN